MNGHRDLEIKLFSTSPPATNSDRRSFFADKSESAVNRCIASNDLEVNSAVNNNGVESSVKPNGKTSEDMSRTGCQSVLKTGESSRNICDLALVTTWDTRVQCSVALYFKWNFSVVEQSRWRYARHLSWTQIV